MSHAAGRHRRRRSPTVIDALRDRAGLRGRHRVPPRAHLLPASSRWCRSPGATASALDRPAGGRHRAARRDPRRARRRRAARRPTRTSRCSTWPAAPCPTHAVRHPDRRRLRRHVDAVAGQPRTSGSSASSVGKGDRLTDWLRRPLNDGQLTYAAGDVEHLLDVYDRLVADLGGAGRLEWAARRVRGRPRPRAAAPAIPTRPGGGSRRSASCAGRPAGVAQAVAALARAPGRRGRPAGALRAARPRRRRRRPAPAEVDRATCARSAASTTATCGATRPTRVLAAVDGGRWPARRRPAEEPSRASSTASCARRSPWCRPGSAS